MIRRNTFLALFLLVLISCKSRKATQLNTALEQKGRTVFNIMVGKNGPSERKLKCLIDGDFKCALQAIAEEEKAFDTVISEINALQTTDIKHGNELKTASVNYYEAVKSLALFDRADIALQQISRDKTNTAQVRDAAIHKQLQLSRDKMEIHKTINKKELVLAEVQKQFDELNHLN